MGKPGRGAVGPARTPRALHERSEGRAPSRRQRDRRIRCPHVQTGVVVGAGKGSDRAPRAAAVVCRDLGAQGSRARDQVFRQLSLGAARKPVANLPEVEQDEQRLELFGAQVASDQREGVGEAVGHALLAKVRDELEHVEAQLPDLGVVPLVDAPYEHMHVQRLRREEGRDLLSDEEVAVVRQP